LIKCNKQHSNKYTVKN